jgi:hypothetical protein
MDRELLDKILDEMHANSLKRARQPPSTAKQRLREAYADWLDEWGDGWDLACSLHVPNSMRAAQAGWGSDWLGRQVGAYFNKIDQRVFNDKYAAKRKRVQRFITYEHADGVGWHAHLLLLTPSHLTPADYIELLRETWRQRVQRFTDDRFDDRLFYCQPIRGRYRGYCLKHAIELGDHTGRPSKGMIDLDNTSRGD